MCAVRLLHVAGGIAVVQRWRGLTLDLALPHTGWAKMVHSARHIYECQFKVAGGSHMHGLRHPVRVDRSVGSESDLYTARKRMRHVPPRRRLRKPCWAARSWAMLELRHSARNVIITTDFNTVGIPALLQAQFCVLHVRPFR